MKKFQILGFQRARRVLLFIAVSLSALYILAFACYTVLVALGHGIAMDSYAANGTFQLYNPLRRLFEGEVLAKDFPFFHGVGIPILHFPIFSLMGHGVFAAEVAKGLVSPLLFFLSSYVIFFALFRSLKKAVIATGLFTVVSFYCIDVIWPGNSLLGVRTTFPFLAAVFMLWQPQWKITLGLRQKRWSVHLYKPFLYLLMGLSVACGTEQGLAFIVAYVLMAIYHAVRQKQPFRRWTISLLTELVFIALAIYGILSLFTLGNAHAALHYALIDVAKDQGWYFGTPPNSLLHWNTLDLLIDKRMLYFMLPVMAAGVAALFAGTKLGLLSKRELSVFSLLLLYGLVVFAVSATGYWAPAAQLIPFERAAGVILVTVVVRLLVAFYKQKITLASSARKPVVMGGLILFIALIGFHAFTVAQKLHWLPVKHILSEARLARHAGDDAYISAAWQNRLNSFRPHIQEGASVWSTYTSIYDSIRKQKNSSPGGEDYIIHALGPERRAAYAQAFMEQRPDYVITLLPQYFVYEEWLWTRHWSFYRFLQDNYVIAATNDSHILWKRAQPNTPQPHQPEKNARQPIRQQHGKYYIDVEPSPETRVYEVSLDYKSKTPPLPVINKLPRYLLEINGSSLQQYPISLPPYETSWQFPVVIGPGDRSIELTPGVYGILPGASLEVFNVSYRDVTPRKENLLMYDNNLPKERVQK